MAIQSIANGWSVVVMNAKKVRHHVRNAHSKDREAASPHLRLGEGLIHRWERRPGLRFAPSALRVCTACGPLRPNAKLLKQINAILPVQICAQKYSAFPVGQISSTSLVS
jgi:hypothetical protein